MYILRMLIGKIFLVNSKLKRYKSKVTISLKGGLVSFFLCFFFFFFYLNFFPIGFLLRLFGCFREAIFSLKMCL